MRPITPDELTRRLRAAGDNLAAFVKREAIKASAHAEAQAKQNATTRPRVASGRLRQSIAARVEERGGELVLILKADTPYARIQEHGGTVYPKRGQWLAIPMGAAKTAAGVTRNSPRDFDDLFFYKSDPNLIAVSRSLGPVFVLVRQVTIPATHFAGSAFKQAAEGLRDALKPGLSVALEAA